VKCDDYAKEVNDEFFNPMNWFGNTMRSGRFFAFEVKGFVMAAPRLATGLWGLVSHPVESREQISDGVVNLAVAAVEDPGGVASNAINSVINANPDKVAEVVGDTLFWVAVGGAAKSTEGADLLRRLKGASEAEAAASLWESRMPGVQLRKVGGFWVKRVDPNANAFMRFWGRQSIRAQAEGLGKLGDMAAEFRYTRSGMLIVRDVGPTMEEGFRLLNPAARSAYLRGSLRMGTFFNDIQPRNIGMNGLIFDPAIDPVTKTLFWSGVGGAVGAGYEFNK